MERRLSIDERGVCPACGGSGIQRNIQTGLNVVCPVCGGTGRWSPRTPFPKWDTVVESETSNLRVNSWR